MRINKHCTNIRIFRKKFQRRKYKFKKFRFKTIIEVLKWETSIQESIELSNYRSRRLEYQDTYSWQVLHSGDKIDPFRNLRSMYVDAKRHRSCRLQGLIQGQRVDCRERFATRVQYASIAYNRRSPWATCSFRR